MRHLGEPHNCHQLPSKTLTPPKLNERYFGGKKKGLESPTAVWDWRQGYQIIASHARM